MSKQVIQKLANSYYSCLIKLFKFNFCNMSNTTINDYLKRYNLFAFTHRIIHRLILFSYKLINTSDTLSRHIKYNDDVESIRCLRNSQDVSQPTINNKWIHEYIKKSNLSEGAVVTYACNMFKVNLKPYPDCNDPKYGYQAIFMSNILHDWDDKTCRFLCKKAYDALHPGGTIILHENLLNEDGNGPLHAALMNMFLFARGKQFKFSELKQFLTETNFVDIDLTVTIEPYSVIDGKKK